jgi:hypothetical protein
MYRGALIRPQNVLWVMSGIISSEWMVQSRPHLFSPTHIQEIALLSASSCDLSTRRHLWNNENIGFHFVIVLFRTKFLWFKLWKKVIEKWKFIYLFLKLLCTIMDHLMMGYLMRNASLDDFANCKNIIECAHTN